MNVLCIFSLKKKNYPKKLQMAKLSKGAALVLRNFIFLFIFYKEECINCGDEELIYHEF